MNTNTIIKTVCVFAVLTIFGCRKEKSPQHLYQAYYVEYNPTDTYTYAIAYFAVKDSTGELIKFNDNNTIKVNGITSNSHLYYIRVHGSDTYEWLYKDIRNVAFQFTLPDKTLVNSISASSVGNISLSVDSVLNRTDTFSASWAGTPLEPDDRLIVSMKREDTSHSKEGLYTQASCTISGNNLYFDYQSTSQLKPGKYRLDIEKRRRFPLQQQTGDASGKITTSLKAYKYVLVK